MHEVPRHRGRIPIGEVVLRPTRTGVQIAGARADLLKASGIGRPRNRVADVLEAVERRHGGMLDAVLSARDESAGSFPLKMNWPRSLKTHR